MNTAPRQRHAFIASLPAWGILLALLSVGCEGTQTFTDTEGRTYLAKCEDKVCSYSLAPSASASASAAPSAAPVINAPPLQTVRLRTMGHLLAICEGESTSGAACRAVTCKDSCPNDPLGNKVSCERGLCVTASPEITKEDVLLLCIAGTGTKRNAQQAARMALARSCGTPCVVPADCRQP